MGARVHALHALLLACALSACEAKEKAPVQEAVAEAIAPSILAVKQAIQETVPKQAPVVNEENKLTAELIIRWEIGSPSTYTKKYQRPEWPGGSSGVTIGVGYDLGFNTANQIRQDWALHSDVDLLTTASGITGTQAKQALPRYRLILTPYPLAEKVFRGSTLPAYTESANRALGDLFVQLDEGDRASLVSLGYNRGWGMLGSRRSEMRYIRDVCVPRLDSICIAGQLRAMKRLWPDVKGLRDRREDEARTAEQF